MSSIETQSISFNPSMGLDKALTEMRCIAGDKMITAFQIVSMMHAIPLADELAVAINCILLQHSR